MAWEKRLNDTIAKLQYDIWVMAYLRTPEKKKRILFSVYILQSVLSDVTAYDLYPEEIKGPLLHV